MVNSELGTYDQLFNKVLVVERRLIGEVDKKDEEGKKRTEAASGFDGNGLKFNNRGFGWIWMDCK